MSVEQHDTSLFGNREVALVDLLDRLLAGGVVLTGDLTISLAGIDLVRVSLRALITSIAPADQVPEDQAPDDREPGVPAVTVGSERLDRAGPDG